MAVAELAQHHAADDPLATVVELESTEVALTAVRRLPPDQADVVMLRVMAGLDTETVARVLHKHRWIAYVGLAIVLYVALDMIWRGFWEVYKVAA